ncbi:MAG: serine hydrolase [Planctomycetota bacterium]
MSFRPAIRHIAAALVAATSLALVTPAPALAQSQTDLVDQTAWGFRTDSPLSSINTFLGFNYRMVDVEVLPNGASTPNFGGSFVQNTGNYAKGWWWYFDQTASQVDALLSANSARLIDVEPYVVNNQVRYAVVMIPNSGSDSAVSGWEPSLSQSQLVDFVNNNPTRRIIDVQPYAFFGVKRYAITWVLNSGSQQSGWWIYVDQTSSQVAARLATNNARLIDIEHEPFTGRLSVIMVPNDGNAWHWFLGVQQADLANLAAQYGVRMIDIERYFTPSGQIRYSFIGRRNDDNLTIQTNEAMRAQLPIAATSGFYLRRVGASDTQLAELQATRGFEPASTIKTFHHYTAMDRVVNGLDNLNAFVGEFQGTTGSCPNGTNPTTRTLRNVLRSMMEQSSNTATEAIRSRYGTGTIEAAANAVGANGLDLNHTVGCLCGLPRNRADLTDLYEIHASVADGDLGGLRDEFYDLMVNSQNFGMGSFDTNAILNDELAASSLPSNTRTAFRNELLFAFKGGSYTCVFGADREEHRSRAGYIRLPFRIGCRIVHREYFLGAWVNDAVTAASAENACGVGLATLYRDRLRSAIDSWENAGCVPFSNYCTAVPNSTGSIGVTGTSGSRFISINDVRITAASVPANQFGLLVYAQSTGFLPGSGTNAGNICLGSPIVRFNDSIQSSGSTGRFTQQLDLEQLPTNSASTIGATSGQTFFFQWWHRDVTPAGQPGSNFTNGLQAIFV